MKTEREVQYIFNTHLQIQKMLNEDFEKRKNQDNLVAMEKNAAILSMIRNILGYYSNKPIEFRS